MREFQNLRDAANLAPGEMGVFLGPAYPFLIYRSATQGFFYTKMTVMGPMPEDLRAPIHPVPNPEDYELGN